MTDAEVRTPVPSWVIGGALLIGSAVLPWALGPGPAMLVTAVIGRLLFLAAMIVFAFGLRGVGSVVAGRTLGVVALLVLGAAPLVFGLIPPQQVEPSDLGLLQLLGYSELAIEAAAALVAVVEIARARVIPGNWRFAPAIALVVVVLVQVIGQVVGVAAGSAGLEQAAVGLALGGFAAAILAPVALGIAAIALGARGLAVPNPQVYPPPA